jgi:RNA polymerase sigma-70 factor (ECF subfamily)
MSGPEVGREGGEHARAPRLVETYERHYRELVVLARWLIDRSDLADEIVQEAFARGYASWSVVRRQDDPLPYVRRTVVNLCNSSLRRRAIARRVVPDRDRYAPSAEREVFVNERRSEVVDAVRSLPRRQRECVVLRFGFDATIQQIAADLGVSEGTVKRHLHRALAALTELLDDQAIEETCR